MSRKMHHFIVSVPAEKGLPASLAASGLRDAMRGHGDFFGKRFRVRKLVAPTWKPSDRSSSTGAASPPPSTFVRGLEAAARWVDRRREAFDAEHGARDPETGAVEYGRGSHAEAKLEYSSELAEIADGIRALIVPMVDPT